MSADKDRNVYPLNRDFIASARLNLQHYQWIQSLGYLLHPSIPLKDNTRIAEIACGTGILSLEIAKTLPPHSRIDAYDLSLAQCPPKGWWPENVTFDELDIFDPIPEPLLASYDVVCIRHFICVVQSGDPTPVLTQLLKLLKPGGHLQWQEFDITTNTLRTADPNTTAPKMQALMDVISGPDRLREQTAWVRDFHHRFENGGDGTAELVAHERKWTPREAMMVRLESSFLGMREWCDNGRRRDPENEGLKKLEKLADDAYGECLRLGRGVVIDNEMVTWVVRKKQ